MQNMIMISSCHCGLVYNLLNVQLRVLFHADPLSAHNGEQPDVTNCVTNINKMGTNARGYYLRGNLTGRSHFSSEQLSTFTYYAVSKGGLAVEENPEARARMLLCGLYRINRRR